jgi:hypothetical protein
MYARLPKIQSDILSVVKSGYLYIIINETFPNWVKVGTTMDLTSRLHTYQTGDPHRRYKIVFSLQHPEFRQAEKKIKETMKHFALSIKGEWYEVDLGIAKSRLEEQLDEYNGLHAEIKIS